MDWSHGRSLGVFKKWYVLPEALIRKGESCALYNDWDPVACRTDNNPKYSHQAFALDLLPVSWEQVLVIHSKLVPCICEGWAMYIIVHVQQWLEPHPKCWLHARDKTPATDISWSYLRPLSKIPKPSQLIPLYRCHYHKTRIFPTYPVIPYCPYETFYLMTS